MPEAVDVAGPWQRRAKESLQSYELHSVSEKAKYPDVSPHDEPGPLQGMLL
jgi:hypothetical protein